MTDEVGKNPAIERGNLVVVAAFTALFVTPLFQFWGAVLGPLRPLSYPQGDLAPSLISFVLGLAVCLLPCWLPPAYFVAWQGQRTRRVLELLGTRRFKRYATNGDLINRWGRRRDPGYRMVRDADSARRWDALALGAERNHLVFLLMGTFSTAYAIRIAWYGWAVVLLTSNVVFNVYPVLLQRYNRLRIARLLGGAKATANRFDAK